MLMKRETAVALVQKVMDVEYTEDEADVVLEQLDRALGCPTGRVAHLIYWPDDGEDLTAAAVVDRALAYRPFAL